MQAPASEKRALYIPDNLDEFLGNAVKLISNYLRENYQESTPVSKYVGPSELRKKFDFTLPAQGGGLDSVLKDLEGALEYSTRTGHIRFYNQLWAGFDLAAIVSEWFLSVMNTSMYTYEVAPVFTLMEIDIIDRYCKMVGYAEGEGTFAPGGAHANYLAMLAARHTVFPHIKKSGLLPEDTNIVCFTSAHAHYTVSRGSSLLGLGTDKCIYVEVDDQGRMLPEALERRINQVKAEGKRILLVSVTAGTSVYGAIDPIDEIADICEKHGIWMHVDACWGGHCLFSKTHSPKLKGIHRADSVSLTATKCFGLPQQCALVVLKKRGMLQSSNAMGADYLFHEYEERTFDLGEMTLNCGRRVDSFKLWVAWRAYGDEGLEARVNHAFDQAAHCVSICNNSEGVFKLAHVPQTLNVCFWYVPKELRGQERTPEIDAKLDKITSLIRRRIQLEGKCLTNFCDVPGVPHFFRHITCNPNASPKDMDFVLAQIKEIGDSLSPDTYA
eukprot:TRINITY_DN2823_c0_g1_i1.p1 TRINITY_DN2823_c0_g1~~TRINITY_DN2823_c0_g1_i1.p1  ORF type:complete len:498 (+),score=215.57 TRINITY_DN2823_c0_g1_i1:43-1536(+)